METTTTQKDRFCLLVALLCENSITEDELKELSQSPVTDFVTITDEIQADIIARRILTDDSIYKMELSSIKVKRVTADLILFNSIKTSTLNGSRNWDLQMPIRAGLNPSMWPVPELRHVPISLVEGEASSLRIDAMGATNPSGRVGEYLITGICTPQFDDGFPVTAIRIPMQSKAPALRAANGLTIECLLTMAEDQLQGLQDGVCPCTENADALFNVRLALSKLQHRTRSRIASNVKNTPVPH